MISVQMTLHSAITGKDSQLVGISIVNDGTGTLTRGNYLWTIRGKRNKLLKQGELKNWPRKAKSPTALLQRILNDAYPISYHSR